MTGDRKKFVSLKEKKDGTVPFGNDGFSNVIGSGTISLRSKDSLAKNVLLVENMNHNMLSVGQMCDQGHIILFNSTNCEIRKGKYGKIVATASRAPNDIYVLDEATKACLLAKEDEIWLWHKRMGHINFDNIVSISKKEAVREMSKISKPSNTLVRPVRTTSRKNVDLKQKNTLHHIHWN